MVIPPAFGVDIRYVAFDLHQKLRAGYEPAMADECFFGRECPGIAHFLCQNPSPTNPQPPTTYTTTSPIVWIGILSFFREIFFGQQGLFYLLERS